MKFYLTSVKIKFPKVLLSSILLIKALKTELSIIECKEVKKKMINYIGMDIHKKFTAAAKDRDGNL